MANAPMVGFALTPGDLEMIFGEVGERQKSNPDEPVLVSMMFVFQAIGERFRKVECVEQEWEGFVCDIPEGEGEPKCPNGHTLNQLSSLAVGWIEVD